MLTPAVFSLILPAAVDLPPEPICIIWRRIHGDCDFFCRSPRSDAKRIIAWDRLQMGLADEDYEVTQG